MPVRPPTNTAARQWSSTTSAASAPACDAARFAGSQTNQHTTATVSVPSADSVRMCASS
ncbi:MAG TPA: hypothetical protein VMV02_08690 [Acidimicrobiales bacterium]|nr:hypothetical protein [Acidimicrobiales bacterium]